MTEYEKAMITYYDMIVAASNEACELLFKDPMTPVFLWYVPSTKTDWGKLRASTLAPEGFELVSSARVPVSYPRQQVMSWVRSECSSLPLFPGV